MWTNIILITCMFYASIVHADHRGGNTQATNQPRGFQSFSDTAVLQNLENPPIQFHRSILERLDKPQIVISEEEARLTEGPVIFFWGHFQSGAKKGSTYNQPNELACGIYLQHRTLRSGLFDGRYLNSGNISIEKIATSIRRRRWLARYFFMIEMSFNAGPYLGTIQCEVATKGRKGITLRDIQNAFGSFFRFEGL